MCLRVGSLALALALLAQSDALGQQPSFGPLTFEEGAPVNRLSYTPATESPDVVPAGSFQADLYLGLSNMFEQDSSETHLIFVDMERLTTAATVRWGVGSGFEVGGRMTLETRSGGFLDGFILGFHDAVGFGQGNRDRFPEERYRYVLGDGSGTPYIEVAPTSLSLEDVRLFAKWRALRSEDGRSVLSLRGVTRIPTGENPVGMERTDVSAMALGRLGVGAWYLHGMLGASTSRAVPRLGEVVRPASTFLSVGVERSLGSSVAALFQYQISTPSLRGFDHRELDWPLSNVLFGLAGKMGDRWRWDVSFQEDVPADAPAIDFTLGARLSYRRD